MIPLITDSINKDCANEDSAGSYTLFVFPFQYKIHAINSHIAENSRYYVQQGGKLMTEWLQRKRYLTEETSNVIHKRAKYYALEDKKNIQVKLSTGIFPAIIESPQLVLFEQESDVDMFSVLHTGFLILETRLINSEKSTLTLDDLLLFNERFRYFNVPYEKHPNFMDDFFYESSKLTGEIDVRIQGMKNGRYDITDHSVSEVEQIKNRSLPNEDDILKLYISRWLNYLEHPVQKANGKFYSLLTLENINNAKQWVCEGLNIKSAAEPDKGCLLYNDDRAFVWTCALTKSGTTSICRHLNLADDIPPYQLGHWIKLLNVDSPASTQGSTHWSTGFEKEWCKSRTYYRWAEFGTLYGFNYHSGALLTEVLKDDDPPLWLHFKTHYFDMCLLLLYIRITLFRFSNRLSQLTEDMMAESANNTWRNDFRQLRQQFAAFTNLYQFPLISNQQQAMEMYVIQRQHMDLDELFEEVESEIKNTHELLELSYSSELQDDADKLAKDADIIAKLGIPIAIVGVFAALFAIANGFKTKVFSNWLPSWQNGILTVPTKFLWGLILMSLMFIGIKYWRKFRNKSKGSNN